MFAITVMDIPLIVGTVFALVILEGLLSADNALVLAVMVRHLPPEQQKRALRYGIVGAFVFRLLAVILSTWLLGFWHFKVVGGLYLLYLAISHFMSGQHDSEMGAKSRFGSSFWGTVVSVELADVAFSIDSIVTAVAMAPQHLGRFWNLGTVWLGGMLGIVAMRFVAGYFIILLNRFKGLAVGAYYLVAWIGLKLVISGFYNAKYLPGEMHEAIFWGGMVLIVILSMLLVPSEPPKKLDDEALVEVGYPDKNEKP